MTSPTTARRHAGTVACPFKHGLIALALALPSLGMAQETAAPSPQSTSPAPALTLAQALDLAVQRHPELAMAQREVDAAQGATLQAGLLPNPELAMSVEDTRQATRTTAFQINQRLELGGKRASRVKAAELLEALNRVQVQGRAAQVRAWVRISYWELVSAQSSMALAHEASQLAQTALDAASKRVAAGKVSPVEETRARLALSGVALEAAQAEQELAAARSRMAALLGRAPAQVPALDATIDLPAQAPQPAELARAMDNAPELVQARLEVQRREALVAVERAKAVPDVTVGLGTQRNNELGRNQTLLGLTIPLPVFDRNQGSLREAMAREDQARDAARSAQLKLSVDVQVTASQLDSARRQALLAEQQMLPDAQRTYEAATTGFSLGKFGFLDVLDAQRTLFQARVQHLRALAQAQRAAAELERLLGSPSHETAEGGPMPPPTVMSGPVDGPRRQPRK